MGKEEVEVKVEEVEEVKVEGVEEVKLEQEVESPARSYDEAVLTSNRRRQRRGQKAKKRPFPRGRKSREPGSESSVEFVSATLSPSLSAPAPPPGFAGSTELGDRGGLSPKESKAPRGLPFVNRSRSVRPSLRVLDHVGLLFWFRSPREIWATKPKPKSKERLVCQQQGEGGAGCVRPACL